jgi:p-aminobenzoyl-glutamate transporter AbgT
MSLVENERTKLLATALNNVGVATLITGVVAPTAATLYGAANAGKDHWWFVVAGVWFLAGIGLHVLGQVVLGRLKP